MANRWPKNLCFLIAIAGLLSIVINYHRLSSIVIDYHRFPYFLGGQKENVLQKKYGEMKLRNSC